MAKGFHNVRFFVEIVADSEEQAHDVRLAIQEAVEQRCELIACQIIRRPMPKQWWMPPDDGVEE